MKEDSIYGEQLNRICPVSYTHLDVYKRQIGHCGGTVEAFTQNMLGYCDAAIAFDDLCRSGRFYGVYASGRGADCDFDSAACGSGLPKGVPGAGEFPPGEMGRRRDADNDYAGLFFNGCGKCGDDLE